MCPLFAGPDRYVKIVRHRGGQLQGRTIHELQTEARRIRSGIASKYLEVMVTDEGHAEWQWLLSV